MPTTFDVDALRDAHHRRDADALTDMYADDAVVTIVDASNPPSNPRKIEGRAAIHDFMTDLCSRDMTHEVPDAIIGTNGASWVTACQYATGERVLAIDTVHLRDGLIVEDTIVQAWDG